MTTAPASEPEPAPQTPPAPWWRSEDWIAVFMATVLIAAALLGWKPEWPKLGWSAFGDLGKVFSGGALRELAGGLNFE